MKFGCQKDVFQFPLYWKYLNVMHKLTSLQESSDILKKLKDWVNTEGIPLEYYTTSNFLRNKFRVIQSDYVEEHGISREIDVLAFNDFESDNSLIRICHVIECKWTKDKPWIVFNSPTAHIANSACISQTIGSLVGSAMLWHAAGESELFALSLFESKGASGFSGRQAFSKDNDLFYNMIKSIVDKTVLSVQRYDQNADPFSYIAIGFPLIVIDGRLFEAHYEKDELELSEVKVSKVHWRGSANWKHHATVAIVTKDYLPEYVDSLTKEVKVLASKLIPALQNIKFLDEVRDINVLNHKPAPRGMTGLPTFIYKIVQSFGP